MKKFILGIVVLSIGLLMLERTLGQDPETRSPVYFDEMMETFAFKSQTESPFLKNGQTHQPPVSGTIPRGSLPLHYDTSDEDLIRAGVELVNPTGGGNAGLARGAQVYNVHCAICHGPGGKGDGEVTRRGFPPPASLLAPQAVGRPDGQIFHMITYGFKNMPPYASQVGRDDRWYAINYIRQLQAGDSEGGTP